MSESSSRFRPAGSRVGDGEIETSTAEKLLALVLAVFIAIGAIWGYFKLDEVAKSDSVAYAPAQKLIGSEESSAIQEHQQAIRLVQRERRERRAATRRLELRREAYRTALDANESSAELRAAYESAQAGLASVSRELEDAVRVEAQTSPSAVAAQQRLSQLRQRAAQQEDEDRAHHDRIVFLLRLVLLIAMLATAYWLLIRLRSRNSRYLPAALAWIGATAVVAAVMAADYADNYIEFAEVGPLANLDRRNSRDTGRVRRFAALPRQARPGAAGSARRVSLLRVPPSRQAALRGVRASGDSQLLELPRGSPGWHPSLWLLRQFVVARQA